MPKDIFRLTSSQSGTYQEHDLSGIALRVPHVEQELLTTFRSTPGFSGIRRSLVFFEVLCR